MSLGATTLDPSSVDLRPTSLVLVVEGVVWPCWASPPGPVSARFTVEALIGYVLIAVGVMALGVCLVARPYVNFWWSLLSAAVAAGAGPVALDHPSAASSA